MCYLIFYLDKRRHEAFKSDDATLTVKPQLMPKPIMVNKKEKPKILPKPLLNPKQYRI